MWEDIINLESMSYDFGLDKSNDSEKEATCCKRKAKKEKWKSKRRQHISLNGGEREVAITNKTRF